ncbi:hypothetical protein [Methanocella arvoryzae]|uniref:CopG family transcriptional regulator n=1 Tax=Methanocella arvoryzae (strain DSM 22066 / NBRC 105507 / MRE50) TaxID=351160 RepID=Q0W2K4_METAR|nr:hypothetical protein [Methanocella arvoryzae]CAJ37389.1 hypothetical protein RCIX2280 [Methanocella arvoryzae MRE50]
MVRMRTLLIELDDEVSAWVERRRGRMRPEEYVGRALKEYLAIDEKGMAVRFTRAHEQMSDKLDELQQRITRLDESLHAGCSGAPVKESGNASIYLYRGRRK